MLGESQLTSLLSQAAIVHSLQTEAAFAEHRAQAVLFLWCINRRQRMREPQSPIFQDVPLPPQQADVHVETEECAQVSCDAAPGVEACVKPRHNHSATMSVT